MPIQRRVRSAATEVEIARPAFGVEAASHGQGLDQGRFSRTVLADQKGDARVKDDALKVAYDRQVERVDAIVPAVASLDLRLDPVGTVQGGHGATRRDRRNGQSITPAAH